MQQGVWKYELSVWQTYKEKEETNTYFTNIGGLSLSVLGKQDRLPLGSFNSTCRAKGINNRNPPHIWKMYILGQFKQNITDETSTFELRKSKRKAGIAPLGPVSAKPALPASFLMRHFTMLMRKFPGGTEAPGWRLGIHLNLYTVRWRQAHRKGSKAGEMEGNQIDLLCCTHLNICSVSSVSPLLLPREQAKTPMLFLFMRTFYSVTPGPAELFRFCFPKHQNNTANPRE